MAFMQLTAHTLLCMKRDTLRALGYAKPNDGVSYQHKNARDLEEYIPFPGTELSCVFRSRAWPSPLAQ